MNIPQNLRYTKDHEWVRVDGNEAVIGITDYAQGELGDIVYIELPDVGATFSQGDSFGTVEAVKAAADMYLPVSGQISAINGLLDQTPELINQEPYENGWTIKIEMADSQEIEILLTADDYGKLISESGRE